jgi:hypothetical protein
MAFVVSEDNTACAVATEWQRLVSAGRGYSSKGLDERVTEDEAKISQDSHKDAIDIESGSGRSAWPQERLMDERFGR